VTYARFLLLFLGPLLVAALLLAWRRIRPPHLLLLVGLSLVVVAWTSPWDSAAVASGLWGFDPARHAGIVLGELPLEEYAFFLLQTWVTSLVLLRWIVR
jgi:lycopene cyclase domain-containing protein